MGTVDELSQKKVEAMAEQQVTMEVDRTTSIVTDGAEGGKTIEVVTNSDENSEADGSLFSRLFGLRLS